MSQRNVGLGTFQATAQMRANVQTVLDTGRLSYGPFCQAFEQRFAALHDCQHAVLANSGTDALRIALQALLERHYWSPGDRVLVPAITFVATVNVVLQNHLVPVLVDVDPTYFHIDPEQIVPQLTERTRAILPVHLFGQPCAIAAVQEIALARKLHLVEDSCETMFVSAGSPARKVGAWGDFGAFSTYMAHLVTTGVGGVITTNDPELAVDARSLVNHGRDGIYISIDDDAEDGDHLREVIAKRFSFPRIGSSSRITELEAAIGLPQLTGGAVADLLLRRRHNAEALTAGLREHEDWLQLPATRPGGEHAWMMYPLAIRQDVKHIAKSDLVHFLEERGIETRDLMPILRQPAYRSRFPGRFPVAEWLDRCGFYIGCHQHLETEDIAYVLQAFSDFVRQHG